MNGQRDLHKGTVRALYKLQRTQILTPRLAQDHSTAPPIRECFNRAGLGWKRVVSAYTFFLEFFSFQINFE